MKCDQFLSALETGGRVSRWHARRHAARCPQCAAALVRWTAVKQELAGESLNAPPLSDWERSVWMRAAEGGASRDRRPAVASWRLSWPRLRGLAAVACAVVVVAVILIRPTPTQVVERLPPPGTTTSPSEVSRSISEVKVEPNGQAEALAELSAGVDRLAEEMQALRRKAERSSARQQVALVLNRFEWR